MNTIKTILFILVLITTLSSCTSETVELLSPETRERIEGEATKAIAVRFIIIPNENKVWSNLVWKADGTWEQTNLGKKYPNPSHWLSATWNPEDYQLSIRVQYEVVVFSSPVLVDQEFCGKIEATEVQHDTDFTKLIFKVNSDFVDCLVDKEDEIELDITILLN